MKNADGFVAGLAVAGFIAVFTLFCSLALKERAENPTPHLLLPERVPATLGGRAQFPNPSKSDNSNSAASAPSAASRAAVTGWGQSEALRAMAAQRPQFTNSLAHARSALLAAGLLRTNEVLQLVDSAFRYYTQATEILSLPETRFLSGNGSYTAIHRNAVTGAQIAFGWSSSARIISSVERRHGEGFGVLVERLRFRKDGSLQSYAIDQFIQGVPAASIIGLDPKGVPQYLNVQVAPTKFFGATFRNGLVFRQKIREASDMTGEAWRR